jgi:hypothetical protein
MPNTTCTQCICDGILAGAGAGAKCHTGCNSNWKPGSSGRGEHVFNNVGKTVLGICEVLQKNVGSDFSFKSGTLANHYESIRFENARLIGRLKELSDLCIYRTGHKDSSAGIDGVKTVGLCSDPENAKGKERKEDKDEEVIIDYGSNYSYFANTITKYYVKSLTFEKKIQPVPRIMIEKAEIEKRVVDKGAKYSVWFELNERKKGDKFDPWYNLTRSQIVRLLEALYETTEEIQKNITRYYSGG